MLISARTLTTTAETRVFNGSEAIQLGWIPFAFVYNVPSCPTIALLSPIFMMSPTVSVVLQWQYWPFMATTSFNEPIVVQGFPVSQLSRCPLRIGTPLPLYSSTVLDRFRMELIVISFER